MPSAFTSEEAEEGLVAGVLTTRTSSVRISCANERRQPSVKLEPQAGKEAAGRGLVSRVGGLTKLE